MLVVAFSGKVGSGKSSVSAAVAQKLGWARVGFGDYVRKVALTQHLEATRQTLQDLGQHLLDTDARAFCEAVLAQAPISSSPLVIDGVRHEHVLQLLKELVAPRKLVHLHLALDDATREDRILSRQDTNDEHDLVRIDAHPTELQVINSLPEQADLVIDASGKLDSVVEQIMLWLWDFDAH